MNGVVGLALSHLGSISLLLARSVREMGRRRPEWEVLLDQLHHLGVRSLAIATVTALFIGLVACHNGFSATGGADGVGRATTQTVVAASLCVLISDFFLTKFFLAF